MEKRADPLAEKVSGLRQRLGEGFNGGLIFQASLRVAVCKGFLTSLFPDTGSAQLINISDSALTDRPTVSQPHPPSLT